MPRPATSDQEAKAGLIARRDEHAAAPVRAARHGLDPLACNAGPGRGVTVPLPARGGADRSRNAIAQDLGQSLAEALEQAERQQINAHVVILIVAARRLQVAAQTFARIVRPGADLAVVVDLIGFFPKLPLPFAALLQQVAPANRRVVRAGKIRAVNAGADALIDAANQAVGDGKTRKNGQVALGNAERHVRPCRVAPLRSNAAPLEDQARGSPARRHRACNLAPRAPFVPLDDADIAPVGIVKAARPWTVVGYGEINRGA